ncbi:MAG: PA2779 family protein [Candidatus Omnitrophota bacterium]
MYLNGLLKRKGIFVFMLAVAVMLGFSPQAGLAMPVNSQPIIANSSSQSIYMEKIQAFLDRQIVQKRLSKLGMSKDAVQEYVGQLDEARLKQLAGRIDKLNAAGDTALVVLLIVLLVAMCVMYFADYRIKLEPRTKNQERRVRE